MNYALWQVAGREVLVSAEEMAYLHRRKTGECGEPQETLVEDGKRYLAYGCVFVNEHAELGSREQLQADMAQWKGYGFSHVDSNGKLYFEELEDFRLLDEAQNGRYPIAVLLKDSALPLPKKGNRLFTLFVHMSDLSLAENLVNRYYVIALNRIKELPAERVPEWETTINEKRLLCASAKIK